MAERRGNTRPTAAKRVTKPGQKHQNTHGWKTDKYHKDGMIDVIKNLQVTSCCPRCTDTIQWKIKYGKYKPCKAPSKCVECLQKTVKHAYHIRCGPCLAKVKKCAKCGDSQSEWVNVEAPTQQEVERKDKEFQADLKALPERRRRTFLRYLARLKTESEGQEGQDATKKLGEMKGKYGKEGGGFDLDDLDEDFDDLGIDENEEDDEDEEDKENSE